MNTPRAPQIGRLVDVVLAALAAVLTIAVCVVMARGVESPRRFGQLAAQVAGLGASQADAPEAPDPGPGEQAREASAADAPATAPSRDGAESAAAATSARLTGHVDRVTGRSLFAPKSPPKFGGKLTGVLGDRAIFNGAKLAGRGEKIMGATVKDLGPDWVDLEFEGKTFRQWVFGERAGASKSAPGGPTPRPPRGPRPPAGTKPEPSP